MKIERCPLEDERKEQCRLPTNHRQKHLFTGPVLTLEAVTVIAIEVALAFAAGKKEGIDAMINDVLALCTAKKETP